jgi:hypothetical protein
LYVALNEDPRASTWEAKKGGHLNPLLLLFPPFFFFYKFILFFPLKYFFFLKNMGVQAVDYRVSTLVVLCKDCSQDVGLYPARHKCTPIDRPAMPTLPSKYQKSTQQYPSSLELNTRTISSGSSSSNTSASPSPSFSSVDQPTSKWSSRLGKSSVSSPTEDQYEGEDSIYYNNFASNLPGDQPTGKKLWGKIKQNDKWKALSEKSKNQKLPKFII